MVFAMDLAWSVVLDVLGFEVVQLLNAACIFRL